MKTKFSNIVKLVLLSLFEKICPYIINILLADAEEAIEHLKTF
jgi:hypothetical protein